MNRAGIPGSWTRAGQAGIVAVWAVAFLCLLAAPVFAQSGTFAPTGSMGTSRSQHTATLLRNGKVLITGGSTLRADANFYVLSSAELYDPATGTFIPTGSMTTERVSHTATLLSNGKVLIAGGIGGLHGGIALATAELYDPASGSFATTGSLVAPP